MNNLLTGVFSKMGSTSALYADVSGRIYLDEAPAGAEFPYIVFSVVSHVPADTFAEDIGETVIQFSLFSNSNSVAEIADMFADLKTLFDNGTLTITGKTFISCERINMTTMVEDVTTANGEETVKAWHVDYLIKAKEGT